MQPNTPAFLPTGEVRPPKKGEWFDHNGAIVSTSMFEYPHARPIYRAVPADSVIELTPEVRCELAFARMWFAWMNAVNYNEDTDDEYDAMLALFEDGERTTDLADAMQRLTLSTTESEGAK